MLLVAHGVDWPSAYQSLSDLGSNAYNYVYLAGIVVAVVGFFFRSRIFKYWGGVFNAFGNAKKTFDATKILADKLKEANKRGDDFKAILDDYKQRYEDFKVEFETRGRESEERLRLLGEELEGIRRKMETAEDLIRILGGDRNALIDYSRLLIGQLFGLGKSPEAPYPKLQSMVAVPGPHSEAEEKK